MNAEIVKWPGRYRAALRKYLAQGPDGSRQPALGLGRRAAALGLEAFDLVEFHERILLSLMPPECSAGTRRQIIARANDFFAEAIVPLEKTRRTALKVDLRVNRMIKTLRRRTVESSAATRSLKQSILLRQGAEQALEKSGKRHSLLLSELHRMQKRVRDMTHKCLSMQEDERQRMSFRLHDEIAQTLIAIDLRLLTLKKAARASTALLKKEIAKTQRLVKESVKRIDQFGHEFGIQHKT